jgi:hypothetical protein
MPFRSSLSLPTKSSLSAFAGGVGFGENICVETPLGTTVMGRDQVPAA